MLIRNACMGDVPQLEALYARARAFMAEHGNPGQWGTDRPDRQLLERELTLGRLYVAEEGGEIAAAFVFHTDGEPSYARIEGEGWPDMGSYGVIHLLASDGSRTGCAGRCVRWCRARCRQLRIDTHEDNIPMQRLLYKLGFRYCGAIYVEDGTPRRAYVL